jgi:TPR repeat protein
MKTSWGKPVHVIAFCRTLMIVLALAVCTVAAEDLETLRKQAGAGDAVAQFNLGWMYHYGDGVAEDDVEAVKWIRKAAEQGLSIAQYVLGVMYNKGQGVPEDDAEAAKWYHKAAEQGYADAQFNLGNMYATGRGVTKDYAEAVKWYRKAAEQGYAKAQYNLGLVYAYGRGVPKDDVAAYAWYSLAAASGSDEARKNRDFIKDELTPSQLDRGQVMAREIFERIEKREAAEKKWEAAETDDIETVLKKAEVGDADTQFYLGFMYDIGRRVPQDFAKAAKWYRKAAEQGHADAQNNLGELYDTGWGVLRDEAAAVKWYRKAAEQGHANAQYNLGVMYHNGRGVAQDFAEAAKWYRKAAEQGDANAQFNLGARYASGKGVAAVSAGALAADSDKDSQNAKLLRDAHILIDSNKPATAIERCDKVIAAFKARYEGGEQKIYCARTSAETLGYLLKATVDETSAVVLSDTWAYAYFIKAFALVDLRRIAEAKANVQLALELSPSNSEYLSELGHVYHVEKNWSKAKQQFESAEGNANLSPEDTRALELGRARRGLAYSFVELGKLDEAEKKLQQCLSADPNDTIAKGELEYVRGLRLKGKP